jgi:intracellular sulfur oxidation DsrE/DsrF family protein
MYYYKFTVSNSNAAAIVLKLTTPATLTCSNVLLPVIFACHNKIHAFPIKSGDTTPGVYLTPSSVKVNLRKQMDCDKELR